MPEIAYIVAAYTAVCGAVLFPLGIVLNLIVRA